MSWTPASENRKGRRQATGLRIESLEDRLVPATFFVDDNGNFSSIPNTFTGRTFTTIGAAVAAANSLAGDNDVIQVLTGTYVEQVRVDGQNGLTLQSVAAFVPGDPAPAASTKAPVSKGAAQIQAPTVAPAPGQGRALIVATGGTNLTAEGFTLDGLNRVDPADPTFALFDTGVLVQGNATGVTIRNNNIQGLLPGGQLTVSPAPADDIGFGVQFGGDPLVANNGGAGTVDGNQITGYRRTGVVVFDAGTSTVTVTNNVIVGAGATTKIAQNGIEFNGAEAAVAPAGFVSRNEVRNNVFTAPGTVFAAGVLLDKSGAVQVTNNTLDANEAGVLVDTTTARIVVAGNTVTNSVGIGIELTVVSGLGALVQGNVVTGSSGAPGAPADQDGIVLINTVNSTVAFNQVTDNTRYGILVSSGTSNNRISQNTVLRNAAVDLFDVQPAGQRLDDSYAGNTFRTRNNARLR